MDEAIRKLMEQQTRWQEGRKDLTWEEKVRMIERVRNDFAKWSCTGGSQSGPGTPRPEPRSDSTPK